MRITFLLPGASPRPTGGVKVVYEYANALVARGHSVTVVHPASLSESSWDPLGLARYVIHGVTRGWRPHAWFELDPRVRMLWVPSLRADLVPEADTVVATWWRTAEILASWPASKGRKHYLIQHLETWGGPEERVLATWKLPLAKIAISQWLIDTGRQLGEKCEYIPNGLDFSRFGIDVDPADRAPASVAMLYHEHEWKGSKEGIEALRVAKNVLPELRAELFGTYRTPAHLPAWIRYHRNPPQRALRDIYNRAAIFVSPSWAEGWPLPPAEALMSGCALACTEIGGHREYAIDGSTALTSAPRDVEGLARNIVRLATDTETRLRIADQGHRFIRQFTWERAVARLESVLRTSVGESRAAVEKSGQEIRA